MSCPPASPSWILMENHRGICFLPSCCAAGWWMERCGLLSSSLVVCSFCCVCVTGWGGAVAHPWMRSCPAPARCLCIRRHKESFQWALLSFRAFVSWELIIAGGVQGLAVQSFFHRKILGELDSKIRTVWPFLRRGAACTGFCYENSWSFQERKSFFVSNPPGLIQFWTVYKGAARTCSWYSVFFHLLITSAFSYHQNQVLQESPVTAVSVELILKIHHSLLSSLFVFLGARWICHCY